jgi:hypothetical protein
MHKKTPNKACTRSPVAPGRHAGAMVVAAKRAARRDGVRVFKQFLWLNRVPSKRRCLVPPTSGYPYPLTGTLGRVLRKRKPLGSSFLH